MASQSKLAIAAAVVPAVRALVDSHDAIVDIAVRLAERSGVDETGIWIADRWLIQPRVDTHRFGLGFAVALSSPEGGPDGGSYLEVEIGPLILTVEYLGELDAPAPAYAGARAA